MFTITKKIDGEPMHYSCNVGCAETYRPHIYPKKEYWLCVGVGWDSEKQDYIYYGITSEKSKHLKPVIEDNWALMPASTTPILESDYRKMYYYGPDYLVKLSDLPHHKPFGRYTAMAPIYEMMQKYKYQMYFNNVNFLDGLVFCIDETKELYFMPTEVYRKADTIKGLFIDGKELHHIYKGYTNLSNLENGKIHSRFTWDSYQTLMGVSHNNVECFADDVLLNAEPLNTASTEVSKNEMEQTKNE